ncbi:hypothetical protein [Candidatus Burkholderia verschuerenii]|uniref:hypothetical protein n=1 Tax=Candidatus Burkholderia verschuerenii TaxID=242163 RepID=UPI00067D1E84|nr:hypothetical protein [Candidatus Burkholderia verschuerenii]
MASTTITRTKKAAAAPAIVMAAAWEKFPTRADFGIEPFDFPAFTLPKLGNAAGVSRSWANEATRLARVTKHGVKVTFDGQTKDYKSVAEAFRDLRLPFEKHIKFRGLVKASGKEAFSHKDKLYLFALIENAPEAAEVVAGH